MKNTQLIDASKAITATDSLASSGRLNPEQADAFIDLVIDVTSISSEVRTVRFRSDEKDIDKINVGRRVALPKAEATASRVRRGIKTSKITLKPENIVVPFEISSDFRAENLEGESVEDTIIRMMATQLANDLEELYLDGNRIGPAAFEDEIYDDGDSTKVVLDDYLKLQDGWLKRAADGHVVDAGLVNINSTLFSRMINSMPNKWKKSRQNLRFLFSTDHEQNYRNTVSGRATAAGDAALSSTQNLTPYGIPLVGVPLLNPKPRVVEHVQLTGLTAVALLHKGVSEVIVTPTTLNGNPTDPYAPTDYTVDISNGTIARTGGSTIPSGATVKVTYRSAGQGLLTPFRNLIIGIGRDITIKKDEDIYADVAQYAIHAKVAVEIEEDDAVVLAKNVGEG